MTTQDLLRDGLSLLQIIWINIILSGDNAVVIALACRGLPPEVRRTGMVLGAGVAIVLRVIFTLLVVALLDTPYLRLIGGLLLLWIAVKLLVEEEEGEGAVKETSRLWSAVWTVAVADMVMSLDNVLAIAAVAKGSTFLLIFGLVISIPLIVAGASVIMMLLGRFPVLVWAGALLLGWVAGEMLVSDPALVARFGQARIDALHYPAALVGAAIVLVGGLLWKRLRHRTA